MQGKFIILEGGEGAGKTTLAHNLDREFTLRGHTVVRTREPGGSPWGEKIRTLLVEKDTTIDHHLSPTAQLIGYYMTKFENLERVILPALQNGHIVVSDRFELSAYAYQVHAQGDGRLDALFLDLHKHIADALRPFRSIYLLCDVHPEIGLARVEKRGESKSIFDAAHLDFHHKVREGMERGALCIDPSFTCVRIDASLSPQEMLERALEACV